MTSQHSVLNVSKVTFRSKQLYNKRPWTRGFETNTQHFLVMVLKQLAFLPDANDLPHAFVSYFETHYNGRRKWGWGLSSWAELNPHFPKNEDKCLSTIPKPNQLFVYFHESIHILNAFTIKSFSFCYSFYHVSLCPSFKRYYHWKLEVLGGEIKLEIII